MFELLCSVISCTSGYRLLYVLANIACTGWYNWARTFRSALANNELINVVFGSNINCCRLRMWRCYLIREMFHIPVFKMLMDCVICLVVSTRIVGYNMPVYLRPRFLLFRHWCKKATVICLYLCFTELLTVILWFSRLIVSTYKKC